MRHHLQSIDSKGKLRLRERVRFNEPKYKQSHCLYFNHRVEGGREFVPVNDKIAMSIQ
jgi:hypothetical protein